MRIPRERAPANMGVVVVPQQKAYVVERLGKYSATLDAGLHFLVPLIDRVAAVHSLKEQTIAVPGQTAITKDNVRLDLDGVLYLRIVDPKAASYGVADPFNATIQLAQTTMRSELVC
jgi:regulator of protease activity HflC (stomatin/prohibitin superfamily)